MSSALAKMRCQIGFGSAAPLLRAVNASAGANSAAPSTAPATAPSPSMASPIAAPPAAPRSTPQTSASRSRPERLRRGPPIGREYLRLEVEQCALRLGRRAQDRRVRRVGDRGEDGRVDELGREVERADLALAAVRPQRRERL